MALTLEGKPWYVSLIVGLVLGGVGLFAVYRFYLGPMRQQIAQQEAKLQDLQHQITRGQAAQQQLPAFRDRVRRLELDLEKLLRILPNRRNVSELLLRFRALAEREDFVLTRVTPGNELEQEFYSEWPITLNLQGSYHNLARFFDRMSRYRRILNVDNLQINALRGTGPHTIAAVFTAKTFVYKDIAPEPEGEGP